MQSNILYIFKWLFCSIIICALTVGNAHAAISDPDFVELCRSGTTQQIIDAITNGANVNARIKNDPAFAFALGNRNAKLEAIEAFIKAGANVNEVFNDSGMTPLIAAAMSKNPDQKAIITYLANAGADVEARISAGYTPLMLLLLNFSLQINPTYNLGAVTALLNAGADVNAKDADGITPVMHATYHVFEGLNIHENLPELLNVLINAGADVNAKDNDGETSLIHAAGSGVSQEVITILLNAGADVNAKDKYGMTALIAAGSMSRITPEAITALINAGADVNAKDNYGLTTLIRVSYTTNNPKVITTLVDAGADINAKDNYGLTPLILAARGAANPEVITALLNLGANPKAKDNEGLTALDYATKNWSEELKNSDAFQKLTEASR